jgi:O-antigen ligase
MEASFAGIRVDRGSLLRIADWLVVAVAVALPWSTSATQILGVAWLVFVVPAVGWTAIRRELVSAVGGLPVCLWCAGLIGLSWSDVGWGARLQEFASFHRLLVIPILFAQYRRSEHGRKVLYGFLISSTVVLIVSMLLIVVPDLAWRGKNVGVPVHDDVSQGSEFLVCAFALIGVGLSAFGKRDRTLTLVTSVMAALFLIDFSMIGLFSRISIVVAPVLGCLLGWRRFRLSGLVFGIMASASIAIVFWFASPTVRERIGSSIDELSNYEVTNEATPIGQHVAFLKESLAIIAAAPFVGHGTGSIGHEFHQITAGKSGVSGEATDNPHNQTFAIAIQLGLVGAILLWSMWIAHFLLFCRDGTIAWIGTVVVVENVLSSVVHSHLFDFVNGWLYIFGVGVLGGMVLRERAQTENCATRPIVLGR